MTIPNLPTDNLYKFISLFGLTRVVLYFFLNYKNDFELQNTTAELSYEADIISFEIDKANDERKSWINNVAELCKTKACDCQITERESFYISVTYGKKDCNSQQIVDEIKRLQDFIKIDPQRLRSKLDLIKAKKNLIERKKETYNNQSDKLYNLFIVGVIMSILGFFFWFIRVQKFQDVILRKQAAEFIEKSENEISLENNSASEIELPSE